MQAETKITITKEQSVKNFGEIVTKTWDVRAMNNPIPRALGLIFEKHGIDWLRSFGVPISYVSELPKNWYKQIDGVFCHKNHQQSFDVKLSVENKSVTISNEEFAEYSIDLEQNNADTWIITFFTCDNQSLTTLKTVDDLLEFLKQNDREFMFNAVYKFSEIKQFITDGKYSSKLFKIDAVEKYAIRSIASLLKNESVI